MATRPAARQAAAQAPQTGLLQRMLSAVGLQRTSAPEATMGGYTGASYSDRLYYWQTSQRDADSDTVRDLGQLRGRSRDLVRNSPIAAGAIDTHVTHVVGSGLTLQSRIDADALGMRPDAAAAWQVNTERRFRLWAASELCDVTHDQDFYEQQDLVERTIFESGDTVVLLAKAEPTPEWPFRLALQIIEADRISNPNLKLDTPELTAGIERTETGAAVAAHICSRHPASGNNDAKWQRVTFRGNSGRRNLLHLKRKRRPGQTRGIPALAPIIGTLKQMTRYSDAEIDAAVNSAAQAVFVKMDPDAFTDLFDEDAQGKIVSSASRWDGSLRSGSAINLLPGESVESPALGRPNPNFDPFMTAFAGYVGIALGIPREVLLKAFNASYSAARAALLDAWRTWSIRRLWLASKFCQPVYEEWLADEVATGKISAPGFFADAVMRAAWCGAAWSGDGPGALDPLKEAKAARERMDLGITTLAEETVAYDGGDWDVKHRQRAREVKSRIADGLQTPAQPAASTGSQPAGSQSARQALNDLTDALDQ
jgi:lambda family phage portal protein